MAYNLPSLRSPRGAHATKSPSPLRHASTISDSEDEEDTLRSGLIPSRASNYTTNSHYALSHSTSGHRRGLSDLSPTKTPLQSTVTPLQTSPTRQSRPQARQTLGDLPQATNVSNNSVPIPNLKPGSVHSRAQSLDAVAQKAPAPVIKPVPQQVRQGHAISRSLSTRDVGGDHSAPVLEERDIKQLGRSATGHFRTLSKLAENGIEKDFAIRTKDEEVTGLHGRRRLQGNLSTKERPLNSPGYGGRIWLDQQRQYLQAYEYLCHIGEAKEWIQDVMGQEIPPIVQLEEHLRDGVTLAEMVQALHPEKTFRIFRNPKLQYRHSDNIAIFFNFLAEVELPELFRFELVDLYEKKNIPKVIYCIHALSWLLFRKGIVDFKIGNLIGQLEFEQHELEDMQKGLDQSGVSMPNFSGLRPEPVEPVETEEERLDRELRQHEATIIDFQSQLRGGLLRLQLGELMNVLWENEEWIVDLQARLRGDWARQVNGYQLSMRQFAVKLQSSARGYLLRSAQRQKSSDWRNHEKDVLRIQTAFRAQKARKQIQAARAQALRHTQSISEMQAAVRGALTRLRLGEHWVQVHDTGDEIASLQKHIRGYLVRKQHQSRSQRVKDFTPAIIALQTQIRARQARTQMTKQAAQLVSRQGEIKDLQSALRSFLLRKAVHHDVQKAVLSTENIVAIQSQARGCLYRNRLFDLLESFKEHEDALAEVQACVRGMAVRSNVTDILDSLEEVETEIIELQTLIRSKLVRAKFEEKQRFFQENMKKVIKIQSFVRGKQQGEAYKSLTSGKNPPVGTVKNFVHLLNDSDFDFEEEFETEKLQQQLVGSIQNIERLESWIAEMDAKIGLLAHNKIASDEAARLRHMPSQSQRHTSSKDSFNLKALNKNSRTKLERYQELFFILQTQPQYLARIFRLLREQGATETDQRRMESLVMSTFAHAQKQREEYYLLKLFARSIQEEVEGSRTLQDFARGTFFFNRLFTAYTRAPRDRKFLRQTFSDLIKKQIIEDNQLNLESDPQLIYRAVLNDEELRTGRCSRDPNLSRESAIKEEDVRAIFVKNLQDIRDRVDSFFMTLEESIPRMPYGTRYMAKQMFDILCARLPQEDQRYILQVVGNWLWRTYLRPSLTDPEGHGVVERSLDPADKRNLGVLSLVLNQIVLGRPFGNDHIYLQPLNRYLSNEALGRMEDIWSQIIDIPDAETKFDIGQFNDFYAKVKPSLYIKMADVFAMHQMVANQVSRLCITGDDAVLQDVLKELGSSKANEAEMSAGQAEVTLSLGGRMHAIEDPDAEVKARFMETKRCALYIIRIQTGSNLMEIMTKPVTPDDEDRWAALVHEELSTASSTRRRNAYTDTGSNNLIDITSLSYGELKQIALENIMWLQSAGRLSAHTNFQEILNDIAVDIRQKHRRRVQRQRELDTVRTTLRHLDEKQRDLQEKLDAYNNTYEQSLTTLQNKSARRGNGLKKFQNPFGKQATHLRELARRGEEPRFGSYKYSAAALANKGILLSWKGRNLKDDDITVSSDAINEFVIEGSRGQMMIPGAVARFTWDELLEAEYEGRDVVEFFGENQDGAGGNVSDVGVGMGMGMGRKSVDVRRGGKSVDLDRGPRRGVLRVDRRAFSELLSKKFWREAS